MKVSEMVASVGAGDGVIVSPPLPPTTGGAPGVKPLTPTLLLSRLLAVGATGATVALGGIIAGLGVKVASAEVSESQAPRIRPMHSSAISNRIRISVTLPIIADLLAPRQSAGGSLPRTVQIGRAS